MKIIRTLFMQQSIPSVLMRNLTILTLILYALAAPLHAQPTKIDRVNASVAEIMKSYQVPGAAIAVIEKGEVVLARGYGISNLEQNISVTIETIFQSGSVGKQFTAFVVMLLVEDGKLGLDDSITKWLPKAPKAWKPITIRHLLNHTAGLPGINDVPDTHLDLRRDYTYDELAAAAFKLRLLFPPGVRWAYSNDGYDLLGIVIAKASGKFYGDILRDRVFAPLGMKTARVISEEDIIPARAAGYRIEKNEIKNQEWVAPSHNRSAAGGLYLSLKDFIAWDMGLREKTLLKPESWAAIYEPARLTKGYKAPYGFGWDLAEYAGRTHYWHSGGWQGFAAQISRFGPDDRTVLVLCNSASCMPGMLVLGIVGALDR
jgi:CubicO group peptidase (beta-lactamase class C family)